MPQVLQRSGGVKLDVDSMYTDQGNAAEYALQGGRRVKVSDARRAKPVILRKGLSFFYEDGTPVTREKDVLNHPGLVDDETGEHVIATIKGERVDIYEAVLAFVRGQEQNGHAPKLAAPAPRPEVTEPEVSRVRRSYVRRGAKKGRRGAGARGRGGVRFSRSDDPRQVREQVVEAPPVTEIKGSEVLDSLAQPGGSQPARVR